MRHPMLVLVALSGVLLTACNSIGPAAVDSAAVPYNEAVASTRDQQMLLNIVRLKYRDIPLFLEVGSVSTQYEMNYGAGAAGSFLSSDSDGREHGANASVTMRFSEKPTITYTPLQGDTFVKQIMAPIPIQTVFLLAQSGWSMRRIMRCATQRVNGIDNAPSASGPTPKRAPNFIDFDRVGELSRDLQLAGGLGLSEYGSPDGSGGLKLRFNRRADPETARELKELLGLSLDHDEFRIVHEYGHPGGDDLALETRSLLGMMFYLSHAVDVPQSDIDAGRVTQTLDATGQPFDWGTMTGDLLQVRTATSRPDAPYVAVQYRGAWFYIDDSDLESKTTFNLLGYLFALQSGARQSFQPTLTLPLGG
jgi:hypothetical protein